MIYVFLPETVSGLGKFTAKLGKWGERAAYTYGDMALNLIDKYIIKGKEIIGNGEVII